MVLTLARAARHLGSRVVSHEAIEGGLAKLGPRAEESLEGWTAEHKAQLVSTFVRGLRNTGVAKAASLERLLVHALDAAPHGSKVAAIADAVSLIVARNLVSTGASHVGMPWSESMRLQAAFSDLARLVSCHGGVVETETTSDAVVVVVRAHVELTTSPRPVWLVALREIIEKVEVSTEGGATRVEFVIHASRKQAAGA